MFVTDYDMTGRNSGCWSNGGSYNRAEVPVITPYNNYFGGGTSAGVMFQDLRESKALAYATFSQYRASTQTQPPLLQFFFIHRLSTDKLSEAMKSLQDLLDQMPKADASFAAAKESFRKCSQRITKADVFFNYLDAPELGNKTDVRRDIFEKVRGYISFAGYQKKFYEANIKGKPTTVLVLVRKRNALDMTVLSKYGTVKVLTLDEIFGF